MPYFDFHVHPTLKSLFSEEDRKTSPYVKIDTRKVPWFIRWCTDMDLVVSSQSNLDQLFKSKVELFGFAVFIPDRSLMDNKLIKGAADPDHSLSVYIQKDQLDKLIDKNQNPYKTLTEEDIPILSKSDDFGFPERKINILKKKSDFVAGDPNQINAFFVVEGLHTLDEQPFSNKIDIEKVKTNLEDLQKTGKVFSVNLCHMEQSNICNHAYGIQFIKDDAFYPVGNGMRTDAYKMVDFLHDEGIMIDVKHMGLKSRLDYYDRYKQQGHKLPILCTHAGLAGISHKEINQYVMQRPVTRKLKSGRKIIHLKYAKPKKYGRYPQPAFNISSVNLYDEDIVQILQSGGMIGLSMDKRILGYVDWERPNNARSPYPHDIEYISAREKFYFYNPDENNKSTFGEKVNDGNCQTWDTIRDGGIVNPAMGQFHIDHFFQQIVHIMVVAESVGIESKQALKQVCLGSDYDGLINPIWCCDSVEEFDNLKELFIKHFEIFCKDSNVGLPNGLSMEELAEDIFLENGKQFILEQLPA